MTLTDAIRCRKLKRPGKDHHAVEVRHQGAAGERGRWVRIGVIKHVKRHWFIGDGVGYRLKEQAKVKLLENAADEYVSDEDTAHDREEQNAKATVNLDRWPLGAPFHRGQVVEHRTMGYCGPVTMCQRRGRRWRVHISVSRSTTVAGWSDCFSKEDS